MRTSQFDPDVVRNVHTIDDEPRNESALRHAPLLDSVPMGQVEDVLWLAALGCEVWSLAEAMLAHICIQRTFAFDRRNKNATIPCDVLALDTKTLEAEFCDYREAASRTIVALLVHIIDHIAIFATDPLLAELDRRHRRPADRALNR